MARFINLKFKKRKELLKIFDDFMVRTSLVRRYCYLNVKDLYCKQTDTSMWRVTHSIWRVRHKKDTVNVTVTPESLT